jgi:acetylornithine deacetylase/succinyl-diaminopimelate desuccinylase-like protein
MRPVFAAAAAVAALAGSVPAQQAIDPTAALLQEVIRANSSNPPGATQGVADVLAPKFRALGFEVTIVPTPDSGKVHFVARLRGDGSKRPILLAAHADVVGVEREKWTVDPFAGVIKDGSVYGRGAIDFKGGLAVFARAAMMLAENKVPLARDVIFMAEADEEGQPLNTGWLANQGYWDLMDCEFALNEGGWIMKRADGSVRYVSISTLDKSAAGITLTAHGTSTHSSMPLPDNAIFRLGRALAKVGEYDPPVELTPSTREFFETLGRTASDPAQRQAFFDLVSNDPATVKAADKKISESPLLHAIMRNTIAAVLVNGGFRSNVIPGSAEATLNIRTIPGTDLNALVRELVRVIDDPLVDVRLTSGRGSSAAASAGGATPGGARGTGRGTGGGRGGRGMPGGTMGRHPAPSAGPVVESPQATELYQALVREAKAMYPGAEVTPYLFQAGTDAGAWRSRGIPVYGIYPYAISDDELSRMHGNDEHVSIESLRQGTEMIYRTILSVAKKP